MKKQILKMAMLMLLPVAVAAQEQQAPSDQPLQLSLKEAVDHAVKYSKQLQTSQKDVEIYREQIRETASACWPQLSAKLGYTTYFGKSLNMGGMEIKMEDASDIVATASWTLNAQSIVGIQVSKLAAKLTEQQSISTELTVKENVVNTYYAILVYEENIKILKRNLENMTEIQNHTQNQYEAGVCEATDVDQIRISVGSIKNSLLATERTCEVTRQLLALQLGLPTGQRIAVSSNLDELLGQGTLVASADSASFRLEENVDYKTMELSRQVGEKTLSMRKWAYAPTLTAAYQYTHNFTGGFMSFDHVGTLTLNIPIFQGFKRDSQIKQAKLDLAKTETNMSLLQDQLLQQDMQYRFELNSAYETYLLQKENVEVARRVFDNYKHKYDQGAVSSMDLTQANTNYLTAESNLASASLQVLMAKTTLDKLYNAL